MHAFCFWHFYFLKKEMEVIGMAVEKEFIKDRTKIENCEITVVSKFSGFSFYRYINKEGSILKEVQFCTIEDKEYTLSETLYEYDEENTYSKTTLFYFDTACPSLIRYSKNNNYLHNPYAPALIEFDCYGNKKKTSYLLDGVYHRSNGPAIIWYRNDGSIVDKSYYLKGEKIKDELRICVIESSNEENS